ncbi:BMP family ABC transporter substrate-binding protein [Clavibacter sp. VKM Ac-2873]|uniref:BMP family lipoprotein n=1 Tax=Clavibacter sp. VKM Ac-2873 TaxID=2783813 RepID=UPI00188B6707|nr:BMP family ABC transporter substrate-binding protein [Clavibacter sp. VKM Ac-2873]
MTITTRKAALGGLAAVGITAILAGCGAAPESTTGGAGGEAKSDLVSCMVSDSGGFDDKSFNQLGYEGLNKAAKDLGLTTPNAVQSASETDFAPNLTNLADNGCGLIITVGFLLKDATEEAAKANPDIDYAIIDDAEITADNVKPITFNTSEAAFLAGYAAAAYSKTGTVGTFGGLQIPTVTIFMDGFVDGVNYFNEQKGKDVKAIGWDVASQSGSFTGEFVANQTAKTAAQTLIDQGADVIMPVGGPIFLSAGEAVRDSSDKKVVMVGVDSDAYETAPDLKDLFLTSVLKGIDSGVEDVVKTAADGEFDATPYVGTLKNGGVDIAPFHDYESAVPSDLSGELETIKAGIIDGSIAVESPSSLTK